MNKSLLVNRILAGKNIVRICNTNYTIIYPCANIRYKADILYEDILRENRFDEFLKPQELVGILMRYKLWELDGDSKLEKYDKAIDDAKVDLFKCRFDEEKEIRKRLSILKKNNPKCSI